MVPICSNIYCKSHAFPYKGLIRSGDRVIIDDSSVLQKVCSCFGASIASKVDRRWHVIQHTANVLMKAKVREGTSTIRNISHKRPLVIHAVSDQDVPCMVSEIESPVISSPRKTLESNKHCGASDDSKTSTSEKQLKALGSYFVKLQREVIGQKCSRRPTKNSEIAATSEENRMTESPSSPQLSDDIMKSIDRINELITDKGINSPSEKPSSLVEETKERNRTRNPLSVGGDDYKSSEVGANNLNNNFIFMTRDDEDASLPFSGESFQDQPYDEASDLYLISILISIKIGVFLFEIATPVRNSDFETLSLPLLYGAKINQLILSGEWWRLVTPMFLHSGLLHVALGCWVLLTFGPQVCREYGQFTFLLIYILGGISGNLSSFFHTPEAAVGGTGPDFAILGAWFIYHIQNKEMTAKEADTMFQRSMILTGLSFLLNNFERIDDWTHLGALCAGLVYGYFTCPILQLDDTSRNNGQDKGITLVKGQINPCKSFAIFIIFIAVLSSPVFLLEPEPINTLELDIFE